jgi:hypothetical protein
MTLGQQFTLTGLDTVEGVRYASGEPAHFDAAVESGRLTGRIGPQEALVLEPAADTVE